MGRRADTNTVVFGPVIGDGVYNPLTLSIQQWQGAAGLSIEARDDDKSLDTHIRSELIDRLKYGITGSPTQHKERAWSQEITAYGTRSENPTFLVFKYQLYCEPECEATSDGCTTRPQVHGSTTVPYHVHNYTTEVTANSPSPNTPGPSQSIAMNASNTFPRQYVVYLVCSGGLLLLVSLAGFLGLIVYKKKRRTQKYDLLQEEPGHEQINDHPSTTIDRSLIHPPASGANVEFENASLHEVEGITRPKYM